jgi:hypothetical protein
VIDRCLKVCGGGRWTRVALLGADVAELQPAGALVASHWKRRMQHVLIDASAVMVLQTSIFGGTIVFSQNELFEACPLKSVF